MKTTLIASIFLGILLFSTGAMSDRYSYPAVYPFVPADKTKIYGDVKTVTEDPDFIYNFQEIISKGLSKARTSEKPWTSSYWPLAKGTIADPYENSMLGYNLDLGWIDWENNYDSLKKRREKVHPTVLQLEQKDLDKLAASEKYDLLLGDTSFDLTNRLVDYMYGWGSAKENSFITKIIHTGEDSLQLAQEYISNNWYSSVEDAFKNSWNLKGTLSAEYALDLVQKRKYSNATDAFAEALEKAAKESENYVLAQKNSRMAAWEGICNGWSTAAGLVPRPRKTVSFDIGNGKKLNFYPADIKGLISLYYVNSLIQDGAWIDENTGLPKTQGTVSAGLRCNIKASKDIFGRYYDSEDDPFNGGRDTRCAGVHPATWHLGLVNLIGKQDRSFIVERKVGPAVDNHPMYKYEMRYYHPNSGRGYFEPQDNDSKRTFEEVVTEIDEDDQFKQFRNPKAKYIVGVETEITYLNYARPNRDETDSEDDDDEVDKKMYYDLELDQNYNIIGGQWRAIKVGIPQTRRRNGGSTRQADRLYNTMPDFFWTVTKDYKSTGWFDSEKGVEAWRDKTKAPPASWKSNAKGFHEFMYKMNVSIGNVPSCRVIDNRTGKFKSVFCEQEYNRPQPYINVLNVLIDRSK